MNTAPPRALHEALHTHSQTRPYAPAVVDGDRVVSYRELDVWSNQLAHQLRVLGVERGDRVGILLDKSVHAIAAVYGVLKAGAAYVPLDPRAPATRLKSIVDDCAPRCVIAGSATRWREVVGSAAVVIADGELSRMTAHEPGVVGSVHVDAQPIRPPNVAVERDDIAYILYTSGSTGRPKGVMLTHGNGLSFVEWAAREFEVTSSDRLSGHAPLSFDLSIFDVFAAALVGATLVLVPNRASMFPDELAQFIAHQRISVWYSVPSALTPLSKSPTHGAALESLRVVLLAGEVCPAPRLRLLMQLMPQARFANLYGPTETNVCTWHEVQRPVGDEPVPIGRALPGTQAFVICEDDRPARLGEIGELWISGPTVARGYWNTASVQGSAFAAVPGTGTPGYRTGDLVRLNAQGVLEFVGRRDHQVKSRGYRIELGDIESALGSHAHVAECVVIAVPDRDITNKLVAVVVATEPMSVGALTQLCATRLPRYMVPHRIDFLPALPKTLTGKIDRQRLTKLYVQGER